MTNAKKSLASIIATAAAACCITACGAKEPPPCGGTTDSSNRNAPKTIQSKDITSFSFYAELWDICHLCNQKVATI